MKRNSKLRYVVVESWCNRDVDWLVTYSREQAIIECKRLRAIGLEARVECRYQVVKLVSF